MQNPQESSQVSEFDDSAWRVICEETAKEANRRCGLSHDYFVELFSAGIDNVVQRLPLIHQDAAIAIAREWDYATDAERLESDQWNADNGYCSHGIELGCCPAGCGSF